MKKQIITKKDIFTDEYYRDLRLLKHSIRLICILNKITFGIFEGRLVNEFNKVYKLHLDRFQNGDYFVKNTNLKNSTNTGV